MLSSYQNCATKNTLATVDSNRRSKVFNAKSIHYWSLKNRVLRESKDVLFDKNCEVCLAKCTETFDSFEQLKEHILMSELIYNR